MIAELMAALIVDVDKVIDGAFTYRITTIPEAPLTPFVAVPAAEYPPFPPKPEFAAGASRFQVVASQLLPPRP